MAACASGRTAGEFTITWDGKSLGKTTDGIVIEITPEMTPVETDAYGVAPIDWIYTANSGKVIFEYMEIAGIINSGAWSGVHGFDKGGGNPTAIDGAGKVGTFVSRDAKQLVITPSANARITWDTAFTGIGGIREAAAPTFTFYLTWPAGPISLLLANQITKGPMEFNMLPDCDHDKQLGSMTWG